MESLHREEALELLRGGEKGIRKWNAYRNGGGEPPDFSQANLIGADLREANLSEANLSGASLNRANLRKAQLREAKLGGAARGGTTS